MPLLRKFLNLFRRRSLEQDMAEEMQLHREHRIEQAVAAGLGRAEAERLANLQFGSVDAAQEAARDTRFVGWLEHLWQDIGYAWRGLCKSPGFAAVVILTIAIGIAGNTACFSLLNSLFLRPLTYPNADRIVMLSESQDGELRPSTAVDTFFHWMDHRDMFEAIGGMHGNNVPMTGRGAPTTESMWLVTAELLDVFSARYSQGRGFTTADFVPGHDGVVVVSYEFWQQRLGGAVDVLGERLVLNDRERIIIGVLEPGAFPLDHGSVYVPTNRVIDPVAPAAGAPPELIVLALLAEGVSPSSAQARLQSLRSTRSPEELGRRADWRILVQSWREVSFGSQRTNVVLVSLVVAATLLIACINIINLVLARNSVRAAEVSLRLALGASTSRIVRQLLTETMLLASIGGTLGGIGGVALYRFAVQWLGLGGNRMIETDPDFRVLLFTAGATALCGLVCGLIPALRSARTQLNATLKTGSQGGSTRRRGRLQSALVITESACTVTLLIIAALFLRSLQQAAGADPGFNPQGVLYFRVTFTPDPNRTTDDGVRIISELLAALRSLPGAETAALGSSIPLGPGGHRTEDIFRVDQSTDQRGLPVGIGSATAEFWQTLQIPLLRGRLMRDSDNGTTAPRVTVVNAELVRRLFDGDGNAALGAPLVWRGQPYEIIGIVGNTPRFELGQEPEPQAYFAPAFYNYTSNFVMRTAVDPISLIDDVQAVLKRLHPDLPINYSGRLTDSAEGTLSFRRMILQVVGLFALVGLVLAAMGVFGVMTYSAHQRTREIGVRVALGATRHNIVLLILNDSLRLITIGMLGGMALAAGLTRLLGAQFAGINSLDPESYALAVTVLGLTGLLATLLPAWRASRADLLAALRAD